jgi:hypothetical protein
MVCRPCSNLALGLSVWLDQVLADLFGISLSHFKYGPSKEAQHTGALRTTPNLGPMPAVMRPPLVVSGRPTLSVMKTPSSRG